MDNIDEIKQSLQNPALSPAYKQILEKRLRELESKSGQPAAAPKPAQAEERKPYVGVGHMTTDEIVAYYSTGQFFRLDQPISGLLALQHLYNMFGLLGKDRATADRVAEAIQRMGGDVPEMQHIAISDLLKKE